MGGESVLKNEWLVEVWRKVDGCVCVGGWVGGGSAMELNGVWYCTKRVCRVCVCVCNRTDFEVKVRPGQSLR